MSGDLSDRLLGGLDGQAALGRRWLQVSLAAPALPASALGAALAGLRADGVDGRWWFVRKHPGLRVRVEVDPEVTGARDAVVRRLERLAPAAVVAYEPELFRFGGAEGLDVAHDHFALDSTLAVLVERAGGAVDHISWSTAVLSDLAGRVCDDGAEVWDAWRRLEAALTSVGATAVQSPSPPGASSEAPTALLDAARAGNGGVAARLRRASLGPEVGPRGWFTAVAVFHWNRLGFGPGEMATVVSAALGEMDSTS